ncbi:SHC-transforming protein 3 [Notechis scutatus]|uniref:SHC-transforming protein 3 n=1 Tax=Notechis scutatus TaxID=8663 RepID=A0A6J1UGB6_9SAUR|nr:SHC-transforming protein 3 [Notechis scutatus]
MLQRSKYNRFRNDSVTSVDDTVHNWSINSKFSSTDTISASSPYLASPENLQKEHGGHITLSTLVPKASHLKLSSTGSLWGIKNLSSAVKELAVSKFQGSSAAETSDNTCSLAIATLSSQQDKNKMSTRKKTWSDEMYLGGEDWNQCGSTANKVPQGWLHSNEKILGPGVMYIVKYLGCIEVLRSMKSLDFNTRTQITREAIGLVCEALPGTKGAFKRRKPPSKALSNILGKSNLQFAGMNISLNISTTSLNLMTPDCKQIIANHHMQSISFASGVDVDTTDYVAYVAKDPVNHRACHILECYDGLAQDIISTIGQAFELRFKQYLQCPSKIPALQDRCSASALGKEQTYYQSQHITDLCGEDRQRAPSRQGSLDIYSMPEGKSNVDPSKEMMPMYVNTRHINMETLHALQTEAENLFTEKVESTKDSRPGKDLFDMSPFEDALKNQMPGPVLNKATSVECTSPLLSRACGAAVAEELSVEPWYQGEMTRKEAEHLLKKSGDFLVRKSTSNPGSYVLTGLQNGQAKHLLLVDPEGVIRTKDRTFDSIGHLIKHHLEYNLPIVSSGTELCLQQPAEKNQ